MLPNNAKSCGKWQTICFNILLSFSPKLIFFLCLLLSFLDCFHSVFLSFFSIKTPMRINAITITSLFPFISNQSRKHTSSLLNSSRFFLLLCTHFSLYELMKLIEGCKCKWHAKLSASQFTFTLKSTSTFTSTSTSTFTFTFTFSYLFIFYSTSTCGGGGKWLGLLLDNFHLSWLSRCCPTKISLMLFIEPSKECFLFNDSLVWQLFWSLWPIFD